jgi:hypothetical protein
VKLLIFIINILIAESIKYIINPVAKKMLGMPLPYPLLIELNALHPFLLRKTDSPSTYEDLQEVRRLKEGDHGNNDWCVQWLRVI